MIWLKSKQKRRKSLFCFKDCSLKNLFTLIIGLMLLGCNQVERIGTIGSKMELASNFIADRTHQVWLPPSYSNSERFYPVLYMHDGQMLFDSTSTWNGQEWGVDEVMERLIEEGKIREAIVVGVWNGDQLRHSEYFPQKPFELLSPEVQDSIYQLERSENQNLFSRPVQSDNYLRFLTEELKPFIDKTYRTKSDRANTFIAGSSMGGLISMYAICEYPDVFGGAICMSTHWPGVFTTENNPIPGTFYRYMRDNLPGPENHKLYFDYGTETLDALYEPFQKEADEIVMSAGYDSRNFLSQKFDGHEHSERDWNKRLHIPLTFLLKKGQ